MNPNLLIDAIVHQTMVLIAQLATNTALRAPLSHVADQVFLDLVRELERQRVPQKVVADMFGMAVRTYQRNILRIAQSATDRDRTLWEAMYEFIAEKGLVSRAQVLQRFARDDEAMARGILRDMVQSGLLFERGTGAHVDYRLATQEDLERLDASDGGDEAAMFVWAAIYRCGPATLGQLEAAVRMDANRLRPLVEQLVVAGRVQTENAPAGTPDDAVQYRATRFLVPLEAKIGWTAAVFDHYQTVVRTIIAKLRGDDPNVPYPGQTGGSTWSFDVWPGHPYESEVVGLLAELRTRVTDLERRVVDHNERSGRPEGHPQVSFYLGQSVRLVDPAPRAQEDSK